MDGKSNGKHAPKASAAPGAARRSWLNPASAPSVPDMKPHLEGVRAELQRVLPAGAPPPSDGACRAVLEWWLAVTFAVIDEFGRRFPAGAVDAEAAEQTVNSDDFFPAVADRAHQQLQRNAAMLSVPASASSSSSSSSSRA